MIKYKRYTLKNGLRVLLHHDKSTPLVAINVLYDVGSKDEDPDHTGFAHLFEHLMFGGTKNIPDFDIPIQEAGGENNAFTNCDMTNFFDIMPAQNIETALWLESDRMRKLKFSKKSLKVQKKVVVEEFKETCLNEPYGDMWHHLSDLAYDVHPYKWPTIGKEISHIENANLDEVKGFFNKFYNPSNAVLVVCGDFDEKNIKNIIEKWFGDIPSGIKYTRNLKQDDVQKIEKSKEIVSDVPANCIYLAFKMPGRLDENYYAYDLLSDVLSEGRSSRLYQKLHKEQHIFSSIDAYISGTNDPGLFIIEGKIMDDVSIEKAEKEIWNLILDLQEKGIAEEELQKVKNKTESNIALSELSVLNKAISLAYYEMIGQTELINTEIDHYNKVSLSEINEVAKTLLTKNNCNKLIYKKADLN
jgi:predicted Zn-dependent peptidase